MKIKRATKSRIQSIRLLTAVPICDGHDSAINTINLEFIRHGIEVIYLGYHRSARDIVRAGIQEDVRAIGISSYNGGHVEFFAEVISLLKKQGATGIRVFGGGGGTITPADVKVMKRGGVDEIFFAGTPMSQIVDFVKSTYGGSRKAVIRRDAHSRFSSDQVLAQALSAVEAGGSFRNLPSRRGPAKSSRSPRIIGLTGPGGAGKTTLIDELVLRFLKANPAERVAILSHDPSMVGQGALLGDRATMIYSQNDRVFMRSLASRGQMGGLARATEQCLQLLKRSGCDLVLVETVGIGQEVMPFGRNLVDKTILVMSPAYGSRLQLQKIVMLGVADIVVVNKSDLAGARTAAVEIEHRLALNERGQKLITTAAKLHGDPGVDDLFRQLSS